MIKLSGLLLTTVLQFAMAQTIPRSIKVVTFNTALVCIGPRCLLAGEKTNERALEIGKWLRAVDADVVFLQEVFQRQDFETIRAASEMPFAAYASPRSALALLSKFPLRDENYHPFRWQGSTKHDCKRLAVRILTGIQTAILTVPEGQEILVANTHPLARHPDLKGFSEFADAITPERLVNIIEMWKTLGSNTRILFGGDFNMNQHSAEYAYFSEITGLTDALRTKMEADGNDWKSQCTFCAENPSVKVQGNPGEGILDHLWISPGAFLPASARIHAETDSISDHRAVSAVLKIQVGAPASFERKPPVVDRLLAYVTSVRIHPLCLLAVPWGWNERNSTIRFLGSLGQGR